LSHADYNKVRVFYSMIITICLQINDINLCLR